MIKKKVKCKLRRKTVHSMLQRISSDMKTIDTILTMKLSLKEVKNLIYLNLRSQVHIAANLEHCRIS